MMRGLWFAAGAVSGAYLLTKARRTAEVLTPEGLGDRLSALSTGASLFAEEVRIGKAHKGTELRAATTLEASRPRALPPAVPTSMARSST